ncbi:MAG: 1-phosphofructokinase family hexose kinase [Roseiarcus sp.]
MPHILTITMNPAIDVSTEVEKVRPTQKLRCGAARREPGGGGVNVARVVGRLGCDVTALYTAGGSVGQLLRRLVDEENIRSLAVPVQEETREDFTAQETVTGDQFRFVLSGPQLSEAEWRRCLEEFEAFGDWPDFVVASGSLPPGVPEDFYVRIAEIARRRGAPLALDASGAPLRAALEHGVELVKPNLNELRALTGKPLADQASWIGACESLIAAGKTKIVALSLGHRGALLVTQDGAWRAAPLPIRPASTVGAGDSFLGAMIWALVSGQSMVDAFRHGVAGGSAALLAPGTGLCHAADLRDLLERVVVEPVTVAPLLQIA